MRLLGQDGYAVLCCSFVLLAAEARNNSVLGEKSEDPPGQVHMRKMGGCGSSLPNCVDDVGVGVYPRKERVSVLTAAPPPESRWYQLHLLWSA